MSKYSPYSYSKMSTYSSCPLKFKFNYIDRLRIDKKVKALEKGSFFHHLCEQYVIGKGRDSKYIIDSDIEEETQKIFNDGINSDSYLNRYLNYLTVGTEVPFGLDKNLNPCNYNHDKAIFRGFIDRICKDKDYIIVDWKSGKFRDISEQGVDQVKLYALWMLQFWNLDKVKCVYLYPEDDNIHELTFTKEQIPDMKKYYLKKIKTIEFDSEFCKNETFLCDWCDYRTAGICLKS